MSAAVTRSVSGEMDELVSVSFIARHMKWHRKRVWRYLKNLDAKQGGGLLINVSRGEKAYFLVGWRALRQAWPGAFTEDQASLTERVCIVEDSIDGLTRAHEAIARELGRTKQRVAELQPGAR